MQPNNLLSDKYVAISNIAGYSAGCYDKCSLQDNQPFEAERWRSPAAGSRSEARAKAGGGQVQCLVRRGSDWDGATSSLPMSPGVWAGHIIMRVRPHFPLLGTLI